jgi:hypothetical protein
MTLRHDAQVSPHLGAEELLALRDRQGTAAQRVHAAECAACAARLDEFEQLRSALRGLDELPAPEGLWSELSLQLAAGKTRRRRWRRVGGVALAAAALALLALAPNTLRWVRGHEAAQRSQQALREQWADVRERSSLLEAELAELAGEPMVLSGRQASAIVAVEDALSQLEGRLRREEALTEPGRSLRSRSGALPSQTGLELWNERLQLQLALVDLHFEPTTLYDL